MTNTINGSNLTVRDFKVNDTVVYIPQHKHGTHTLDDCEAGRITSINQRFVFIQFMDGGGEYKESSQACNPNDVWHRL